MEKVSKDSNIDGNVLNYFVVDNFVGTKQAKL